MYTYSITVDINNETILKEVNKDLKEDGYELLLDFKNEEMPFTEVYNKMTLKISNFHNDILNDLAELENFSECEKQFTMKRIKALLYDVNILEESRNNLLALHLGIEENKPEPKSDADLFIEKYFEQTKKDIEDAESIINKILGNETDKDLLKKKILGKVIIL